MESSAKVRMVFMVLVSSTLESSHVFTARVLSTGGPKEIVAFMLDVGVAIAE